MPLCGAGFQHRTRREAARKAAIWRVCGAARAVQLNTREENLLHAKLRYYEIIDVYQTRKDDANDFYETSESNHCRRTTLHAATARIYAHAFDKNKREAQQKLGKAIGL